MLNIIQYDKEKELMLCPNCDSDDLEARVPIDRGEYISREIICLECGVEWSEEFVFDLWDFIDGKTPKDVSQIKCLDYSSIAIAVNHGKAVFWKNENMFVGLKDGEYKIFDRGTGLSIMLTWSDGYTLVNDAEEFYVDSRMKYCKDSNEIKERHESSGS